MIHFLWPWIWLALPAPWLVRRLLPPASHTPGAALKVPFFQRVAGLANTSGHAGTHRKSTHAVAWLIWILLVAAATRPQWLGEPISLPMSGRDILLAVDISGSMEIPDFTLNGEQATRLRVIKDTAADFIERREGDQVGLILFGSRAYLQTPLTFDRDTTITMLEDASIGLAGKDTALGDAIGLAIKRLRDKANEKQVLILLTDGANTAGEVDPERAAQLAAEQGLRIYTIGVGGDPRQSTIPSLFGTRFMNPSVELDEELLKQIADTTDGAYFRAKDTSGLEDIYQQLNELEPRPSDERLFRPVRALYHWPLTGALVLSFLWAIIRVSPVPVGVITGDQRRPNTSKRSRREVT